jgi:hypothetical protein
MQSDPRGKGDSSVVEARRRFLRTCGRFSVATPPAIALLLASAERNYAVAQSGVGPQHSSDSSHGDRAATQTSTLTGGGKGGHH